MNRDARTLIGAAGLACIACCIGPIVAILGAIGAATITGVAIIGIAGTATGLLAVPVLVRRRQHRCQSGEPSHTITVAAPTTRTRPNGAPQTRT